MVMEHFQLHFGVNSGSHRFALENQAVNEATFRCPDELGWKPQVAILLRFYLCYFHIQAYSFFILYFFMTTLHSIINSFSTFQRMPIMSSDGSILHARQVYILVVAFNHYESHWKTCVSLSHCVVDLLSCKSAVLLNPISVYYIHFIFKSTNQVQIFLC